nr:MAG: hypothetical protein [Bacteriophage sp.]
MSNFNWLAYLQHGNVVIEAPTGLPLVFPETDTRYTLSPASIPDAGDGYSLVTLPSLTSYFLPNPDVGFPIGLAKLHAVLDRYFINTESPKLFHTQENPKKYMRLPNSNAVVYLVDILSVSRLTHGDHRGNELFIRYPVGEICVVCDTLEKAIADEHALNEYLLSLQ